MNRERTCIGCRKKAAKGDFLRIARLSDGSMNIDSEGNSDGRGAYFCSIRCLEESLEKGRLSSALRTKVSREKNEELLLGAEEFFGKMLS